MIDTSTTRQVNGSAQRQASLWGRAAKDWSELAEVRMQALFEAVLDDLEVGPGRRLLDIGCGSGVAAAIAAARGAEVHGLDAAEALLVYAHQRAPGAEFRQGEMEDLPWPDDTFDIVTGFNAFQYAANPVNALAEARRVTRPGGSVAIVTWGRPEQVQMAAVMRAVGALLPPPSPGAPGPFALSQDGALAALARQAGLQPHHEGAHRDRWFFPDLTTARRALLSAGVMTPAITQHGEERVGEVIAEAIAPFRTPDGGYRIESEFVYLVARA